MIHVKNQRIDASIRKEAITVIFGASGVGKSTLLKQIAGHVPLNGTLTYDGETIEDAKNHLKAEKRNFSYLSQRQNLINTLTVRENLELALKFSEAPEPDKQLTEMIEMVEIESLLDRKTGELSGGETQAVSFCLVMLSKSRLHLFDEPFSALDKPRLHRILTRLKKWHRAEMSPILYVTHDVHEMALVADDVLHMTRPDTAALMTYSELIQAVNSDYIDQYAYENIIETRWLRSEDDIQVLHLSDDPDQIIWALGEAPTDVIQRLTVPLRDISLSRYKLMESSILNQLEGVVHAIGDDRDGLCYVSVLVAGQYISVRITSRSRKDLHLRTGMLCVVFFKAPKLVGL